MRERQKKREGIIEGHPRNDLSVSLSLLNGMDLPLTFHTLGIITKIKRFSKPAKLKIHGNFLCYDIIFTLREWFPPVGVESEA